MKIPSNWKKQRLEEISNLGAGGTPSRLNTNYWENGVIPWLSSGEIKNNRINESLEKITELGLRESAAKKLPKGTVLIAITGQGTTRGRTAILNIEATTNQSVIGIICNKHILDNVFLWYYLQNQYHKLRSISQGSNQAGLNLGILNSYEIIFPQDIKEQQKIASILSNVDDLITKYDSIIESTKKLKQGLMQQLLTKGIGHTKFKNTKIGLIPDKWEIRKISEVSKKLVSGGTPPTSNPEYWNGTIPWTKSAVLTQHYVDKGERFITTKGLENSSSTIIPKNNLLVASRVSMGNLSINKIDIAINQDVTGIIVDDAKISEEYLYWFLFINVSKLISFSQGSTIQGFTRKELAEFLVALPSLKEQQKITSILSNVDVKITDLQSKKTHLQNVKKGLMQKLLTGQIRVKV